MPEPQRQSRSAVHREIIGCGVKLRPERPLRRRQNIEAGLECRHGTSSIYSTPTIRRAKAFAEHWQNSSRYQVQELAPINRRRVTAGEESG
jgi:hypothetical protein